jgi:hypothetical protein
MVDFVSLSETPIGLFGQVQQELQKPDRTAQNIRIGSEQMRNMLSAATSSVGLVVHFPDRLVVDFPDRSTESDCHSD